MYLALTLGNVPTTPRLKIDQKPSIVFVCTAPTTYLWALWFRLCADNQSDFHRRGFHRSRAS
jgi:hypothetical protein